MELFVWHRLWVDNGRPSQGHIVKMLKRNQNKLMSNKMAVSLQSNCKRSFWQEAKRIIGNSLSAVNSIDSVNGSDQIGNLFAYNYKELFTSVSYDSIEMKNLISKMGIWL